MKTVFMIACCAVLSIVANSECVTVGDARLPEHSPYLVIVVELAGKPLHGVKVDLYEKAGKEAVFSGVTDEQGMVTPPNLAIGDYNIFAALNQAVVSSLQLRIARNGSAVPLSISLGSIPAGASENEPVRDHLQEFRGTVLDPSGAAIPAAIVVVSRGSQDMSVVLRTTADPDGHFSEKLSDGSYIAFFFANGFDTATLPFEINAKGSGQLHVNLRIGKC